MSEFESYDISEETEEVLDEVENEPEPSRFTPSDDYEEVALQVLAGDWGEKAGRTERLAEAGYDPNKVLSALTKIRLA